MAAIYEVTIEIDDSIRSSYAKWLRRHAAEVVEAAQFDRAVLTRLNDAPVTTWVVQYWARDRRQIEHYLTHLASQFRADGVQRFGSKARAHRRVLDLTETVEKSDIGSNPRKEIPMSTQANWQKIRNEFSRLTNVDELRSEVHRIGTELRKFDFHSVLSPTAKARVKMFERRYAELMRTMQQAQRQVDREFNRILRQIKAQQTTVNKVVYQQKAKLNDLGKKFAAGSKKMKKAGPKKAKTSKKTTTKGTKKRSK